MIKLLFIAAMGYMGFGLQKWIYSQKPRKAFSKDRKPTGDEISSYKGNELNLKGREIRDPEKAKIRLAKTREKLRKKRIQGRVFSLIIIFTLTFFIVLLISGNFKFTSYVTQNENKKRLIEEQYRKEGFKELMKSGNRHLLYSDYPMAVMNFKTAVEIFPQNMEAQRKLGFAYYMQCLSEDRGCSEAIDQLDYLINNDTSSIHFKYRSELHLKLGNNEKAEFDAKKFKFLRN